MHHSKRPHGFFNPQLAAATSHWATRPNSESDKLLRAACRVIRRRRLPINIFRVSFQRSFTRTDSRSCLTWHHAANHALTLAAICRRQGKFVSARQHLQQAHAFTGLSRGWSAA